MSDLAEHPDERRWFDRMAELHGSPLVAVAATLSNWSAISPPQGSYAQQLAIMTNEVSRASARLAAAEAREARLVGALRNLLAALDAEAKAEAAEQNATDNYSGNIRSYAADLHDAHIDALVQISNARAALSTAPAALAQAIEGVVRFVAALADVATWDAHEQDELRSRVAALRAAWRGA